MTEKLEKKDEVVTDKPSGKRQRKVQEVPLSVERKVVVPRVSFDQWAKKRKIKQHHLGGMRAFIKGAQVRTIEDWDRLFQSY